MEQSVKELVEKYAEDVKEEQLELLRTLGKIPAPSHQEDQRAAFVRDWFLKIGAKDVTIDKLKLLDIFFLPHFNQPYNYITMAALGAK